MPSSTTSWSPSAATWSGSHRDATTVPAATPSCSGSSSPTRASTSSTGCSSTTRLRTAKRRRLQGRAPRQGGPQHLDRRRPHPGRRGRHRAPTRSTATCSSPTEHAPTRCRTSRSRPARSSAPATPARPAASTTSSCSTCSRAGSPRRRPAGWSSAASSPTSSVGSASRRSQERLNAAIEAELAPRRGGGA